MKPTNEMLEQVKKDNPHATPSEIIDELRKLCRPEEDGLGEVWDELKTLMFEKFAREQEGRKKKPKTS